AREAAARRLEELSKKAGNPDVQKQAAELLENMKTGEENPAGTAKKPTPEQGRKDEAKIDQPGSKGNPGDKQDDKGEGNKNGKPGDKPGDKSIKPGGNNNSKDPQNQDDKTPRPQDGSGNTSGNLGGDTPDLNDQGPVKGSASNPNYGKKAGELQLE